MPTVNSSVSPRRSVMNTSALVWATNALTSGPPAPPTPPPPCAVRSVPARAVVGPGAAVPDGFEIDLLQVRPVTRSVSVALRVPPARWPARPWRRA